MSTVRVTVAEARAESPSRPIRLGLWLRVRRAVFVCRLVVAALPAIVRAAWRDTWTDWRKSRELLAQARRTRAGQNLTERDATVPNGTTPRAPAGPRLLSRPAGDDITAMMMRDSSFMLLMAGEAVAGFEALGRGALYVVFEGEQPGPFTCRYHPIETLRAVGVSGEIMAAVASYVPVSEAVIALVGPAGMRAASVGVERIGRPGAQG
jgi:hypothetical protein